MKHKILLLVAATLSFTAGNANAERWIVKNPRASLAAFAPVKSFSLNNNQYMVVDAPAFTTFAELRTYGDSAFPDAKISLPDAIPADDGEKQIAWHVKAMQYDKLPQEFNGKGIVVAVVDTGVDTAHPSLSEHLWTNPKEIAGNGIDDDANGYIDDIHGWDFERNTANYFDDNGHGTHCAGMIAASPNPDTLAQGVAPGAQIMAIRIIGDKNVGFISDAVTGIKYAVDNGAKVLSNSWRLYKSWEAFDPSEENIKLLRDAVAYAGDHGAVFVAAAGNESTNLDTDSESDPMFPGGFTGLGSFIVVAASGETGEPAYFTNYGAEHVGVAAPGVSIQSTYLNNGWTSMSGTSMATPLIAGAVARGLSAGYLPADIGERLVTTSTAGSTSWANKVKAKGVVDLVRYMSP